MIPREIIVRARDLLLPGIVGIESRFDERVLGDIEICEDGSLSLMLSSEDKTARIFLTSAADLESGDYKATFMAIACSAFSAFDQALHPEAYVADVPHGTV